jgi:hypothetical protein
MRKTVTARGTRRSGEGEEKTKRALNQNALYACMKIKYQTPLNCFKRQ